MVEVSSAGISRSFEHRISMEFRKPFFRDWDRRFLIILFISLTVESLLVFLLARRPIAEYSEKEIANIQERFANFVLKAAVRKEKETASVSSRGDIMPSREKKVSEKVREGEGEGEKKEISSIERKSVEIRQAERLAAAEARRRSREAISREVSHKGLLGLLTGTGSATEGKAVTGLFRDSGIGKGVGADLDQILGSVDGLKTQGSSGLGRDAESESWDVRGERSGRKANIDDLVSDFGSTRSESISRKGELKIETPTEVEGRGRKSIHRSPEAIQEVLLSHVPAIRYCYERELKRNPTLKGKISVRITVRPDGRVKKVSILSSTLNNERVERCILTRIRLWKDFNPIDPTEGDVSFRWVYAFGY